MPVIARCSVFRAFFIDFGCKYTIKSKVVPHSLASGPSPSLVGLVTVNTLYSAIKGESGASLPHEQSSLIRGPPGEVLCALFLGR